MREMLPFRPLAILKCCVTKWVAWSVWITGEMTARWRHASVDMLTGFSVFLQEFAGEDTSDLFLEEREASLRQAQEEKHKLQMSVPGILNPHEIPEEMCD